MELIRVLLYVAASASLALLSTPATAKIDTTERNANGTGVVLLAIAEIERTGIFASDNGLLRRIAYEETRDGAGTDTYSSESFHGGIWAVTWDNFLATKNIQNPRLPAKIDEINGSFSIEWSSQIANGKIT